MDVDRPRLSVGLKNLVRSEVPRESALYTG